MSNAQSFMSELAELRQANMPVIEHVAPKDFSQQALVALGGMQAITKALGWAAITHDHRAHTLKIKLRTPTRFGINNIHVYLKGGKAAYELIRTTYTESYDFGRVMNYKSVCRAAGLSFDDLKTSLERYLKITF